MVAVSVVLGAQIVGSADDSVEVWTVGVDAARGTPVEELGLVASRVRFTADADAARYLMVADGAPEGRHLVRAVGAGELLPGAAVGEAPEDVVVISVEVPTAQLPPGVRAGSVVDLWTAPRNSGESRSPRELLRGVTVVSASSPGQELSVASDDRQVVLQVPDRSDDVADVVAASGAGELVLVGRG